MGTRDDPNCLQTGEEVPLYDFVATHNGEEKARQKCLVVWGLLVCAEQEIRKMIRGTEVSQCWVNDDDCF